MYNNGNNELSLLDSDNIEIKDESNFNLYRYRKKDNEYNLGIIRKRLRQIATKKVQKIDIILDKILGNEN